MPPEDTTTVDPQPTLAAAAAALDEDSRAAPRFASEGEELTYWRAKAREDATREYVDSRAQAMFEQVRTAHEQDRARVEEMVSSVFERQMKSWLESDGFKSGVRQTMEHATYPRRTPPQVALGTPLAGDVLDRNGNLLVTPGGKALAGPGQPYGVYTLPAQQYQAPSTYGRQVPMGPGYGPAPQQTFGATQYGLKAFMAAVTRKDLGAIAQIYAAHGMKALTEDGGFLLGPNTTGGPPGGYLSPPAFLGEMIDLLRAQVALLRAGAELRTMTSNIVYIPSLETAATAQYQGEATQIVASQEAFGQRQLIAHKLTALVPLSNELFRDSSPSAEDTIRDDMVKVIARKMDLAYMIGVGSATAPTGIFTRPGVQTIAAATNGTAVTWNMLVNMQALLASANVPFIRRAWFLNPLLYASILQAKDTQGRPLFTDFLDPQANVVIGGYVQRTLFGYPVFETTQLPANTTQGTGTVGDIALVEMSEVIIGQHLELILDTSTEANYFDGSQWVSLFQNDMRAYRAVTRGDITMRHDQAVVLQKAVLVPAAS